MPSITAHYDIRHPNVVLALLKRAAVENQRKLNARLDEVTLQQLEPRATAAPAFNKPINSCCSAAL